MTKTKHTSEKKTRNGLMWTVEHPSRSTISAILELQEAERQGRGSRLSLRQTTGLLTHLRAAIRAARWDKSCAQRHRIDVIEMVPIGADA